MRNQVYATIRHLPDDALQQFRAGIACDIESRKRRGREYTSLRRYLSVAALEMEIRGRRARLMQELEKAESYFDWQDRADLR